MCGIAGYVGGRNAPEILFDMLKRLEYRGYDSAGLAFITNGKIVIPKDKGKVDEVRAKVKPAEHKSKIGVAHTRWATHGKPSQLNAHPHSDCTRKIAVAHNGIIENYSNLARELVERGHRFDSETDTEVIAHLIEEYFDGDFMEAFRKCLLRLEGSYAIAAVSTECPDRIFIARKESPLIVGLGSKENFIASDAPAFLPMTRKALFLEDFEYGFVCRGGFELRGLKSDKKVPKKTTEISWSVEEAEKGGFHHFMLKEIMEEPQAARNALRSIQDLRKIAENLARKRRIIFVACGTAYHAGLVGKYVLEEYGIPAEAVVASEFRYSTVESLDGDAAVVAISQSGETADTLAAVKSARKRGAYVASIVNVVGSTMTRVSDDVAYIHAGPEIAVASTKAYVGQLVSLIFLSLHAAKTKGRIGEGEYKKLVDELKNTPSKIKKILKENNVKSLAEKYANTQTFFFIGRKQHYPTALEGALKLKEISYVHAEGYPAGELKHGPLALLDEKVVVMAITPEDNLRDKMQSNISEVKARGATVIEVSERGGLLIPKSSPVIAPVLAIVPLHLFAYYISVLKGLDPDKPRNLAKSVTVE
jgi:glucosamine--fructose-6-phosphate aminotransferase (isomerizing)